jgi:hypothetical protein
LELAYNTFVALSLKHSEVKSYRRMASTEHLKFPVFFLLEGNLARRKKFAPDCVHRLPVSLLLSLCPVAARDISPDAKGVRQSGCFSLGSAEYVTRLVARYSTFTTFTTFTAVLTVVLEVLVG